MNALLIIDVQNDFCPGGTLAVPEGEKVVPVINGIMKHFDLVIATQDWHPADHVSFAASHTGHVVGEMIVAEGLQQILWPVHCVQNSHGAELHPQLNANGIEKIIRKGTERDVDSYSAFFDNGRRHQTELDAFLKTQNVTDLTVCGLATDYCVKFSVLDALSLGYAVTVLVEACRGVNLHDGDVNAALEEMQTEGATICAGEP